MSQKARACVALIILGLLAACGSPATTGTPSTATDSTATSASPAATDSTATSASPAASSSANGASFPRTIAHERGELTVPRAPQRVVALDWLYTEELLALGMQPAGAADIENYKLWVKTPATIDAAVTDVGLRGEPNLETIAALKPDLILANSPNDDPHYEQLSAIAPTLLLNPFEPVNGMNQLSAMRASFRTVAQALGRDAEADVVLTRLDQQLATMATQLNGAGLNGQPFVVAQAYSADNAAEVRLFNSNALATQVVEQLGLKCAWTQSDEAYAAWGFSAVSVEVLPQLGDAHFFYVVQDNDNVFATNGVKPLWDSLAFVKAGRAHPLGGDTWFFGGPLSAERLAATVTQALLERDGS